MGIEPNHNPLGDYDRMGVSRHLFHGYAMSLEVTPAMIASFRAFSAAFGDSAVWPDDVVTMALNEGITETNARRWGKYRDHPQNYRRRGIFYFAAHWLSSTYVTGTAADPSNINSAARLNLSGKSVGDESVQYRITEIQSTGDDWLSTTLYGVQYLRLRDRAGLGGEIV